MEMKLTFAIEDPHSLVSKRVSALLLSINKLLDLIHTHRILPPNLPQAALAAILLARPGEDLRLVHALPPRWRDLHRGIQGASEDVS